MFGPKPKVLPITPSGKESVPKNGGESIKLSNDYQDFILQKLSSPYRNPLRLSNEVHLGRQKRPHWLVPRSKNSALF
jgi:hypothetical protein